MRFYGAPSVEYLFRKYVNLPNLEEFVHEIAIEAFKVKRGGVVDFNVHTQSNAENESPLVILDGVPLFKTDQLATLPCNKLESIRIVSKRFYWGSETFNGIIDITSKDKSLNLVDLASNSKKVIFPSLIISKENRLLTNNRTPVYLSDVHFDVIHSKSNVAELKIKMPQNTGNYSIQLLG